MVGETFPSLPLRFSSPPPFSPPHSAPVLPLLPPVRCRPFMLLFSLVRIPRRPCRSRSVPAPRPASTFSPHGLSRPRQVFGRLARICSRRYSAAVIVSLCSVPPRCFVESGSAMWGRHLVLAAPSRASPSRCWSAPRRSRRTVSPLLTAAASSPVVTPAWRPPRSCLARRGTLAVCPTARGTRRRSAPHVDPVSCVRDGPAGPRGRSPPSGLFR